MKINLKILLFFLHEKQIFCKKFHHHLERIGELIVLKFEKFCRRFFDEPNIPLNIENFQNKNDSLLKERKFLWEIAVEDEIDMERKSYNILLPRFINKMLVQISKRIILFFEFDEVFFSEIIFISKLENNKNTTLETLNKNFILHEPTNLNYNTYVIQKNKKLIKIKKEILKLIGKLLKFSSKKIIRLEPQLELRKYYSMRFY
ncbi:MAG: hypothetical protein JEY97_04645 [Bacteroidales bacterium]|nr:hypothetical protein [Bacteroidales bacterium]